ncbi:MAG: class I SAM-dependent methyltransferase [Rhodospirillaceae bacterium]|nr:class I SAM-dependent methyltransferase [Rhodospirillaceae bacterium]
MAKSRATEPDDIQPRGAVGRTERLPTLAASSRHDFMTMMRRFVNADMTQAARLRGTQIVRAAGIAPDADLPVDQVRALFEKDPLIATRNAVWYGVHNYTYRILSEVFEDNAEVYLAELDAFDRRGPGTLELNPSLALPDYVRHEIHQQPGGYVGNPFAGHLYHYHTNHFYGGRNDQDERHRGYAAAAPLPGDGRVKRILDLGCGIGQLAVALKERFPEAEVWGIDVGAPMLRYGHMRAVDLGVDINLSQRLAEDTKFPDGHFDLIASYILFHEVTAEAAGQIIAEAHRVLRPGGVFYPLDFNLKARPSPYRTYSQWIDHRWNNERWRIEYDGVDFSGLMARAGFNVTDTSDASSTFGAISGIRRA